MSNLQLPANSNNSLKTSNFGSQTQNLDGLPDLSIDDSKTESNLSVQPETEPVPVPSVGLVPSTQLKPPRKLPLGGSFWSVGSSINKFLRPVVHHHLQQSKIIQNEIPPADPPSDHEVKEPEPVKKMSDAKPPVVESKPCPVLHSVVSLQTLRISERKVKRGTQTEGPWTIIPRGMADDEISRTLYARNFNFKIPGPGPDPNVKSQAAAAVVKSPAKDSASLEASVSASELNPPNPSGEVPVTAPVINPNPSTSFNAQNILLCAQQLLLETAEKIAANNNNNNNKYGVIVSGAENNAPILPLQGNDVAGFFQPQPPDVTLQSDLDFEALVNQVLQGTGANNSLKPLILKLLHDSYVEEQQQQQQYQQQQQPVSQLQLQQQQPLSTVIWPNGTPNFQNSYGAPPVYHPYLGATYPKSDLVQFPNGSSCTNNLNPNPKRPTKNSWKSHPPCGQLPCGCRCRKSGQGQESEARGCDHSEFNASPVPKWSFSGPSSGSGRRKGSFNRCGGSRRERSLNPNMNPHPNACSHYGFDNPNNMSLKSFLNPENPNIYNNNNNNCNNNSINQGQCQSNDLNSCFENKNIWNRAQGQGQCRCNSSNHSHSHSRHTRCPYEKNFISLNRRKFEGSRKKCGCCSKGPGCDCNKTDSHSQRPASELTSPSKLLTTIANSLNDDDIKCLLTEVISGNPSRRRSQTPPPPPLPPQCDNQPGQCRSQTPISELQPVEEVLKLFRQKSTQGYLQGNPRDTRDHLTRVPSVSEATQAVTTVNVSVDTEEEIQLDPVPGLRLGSGSIHPPVSISSKHKISVKKSFEKIKANKPKKSSAAPPPLLLPPPPTPPHRPSPPPPDPAPTPSPPSSILSQSTTGKSVREHRSFGPLPVPRDRDRDRDRDRERERERERDDDEISSQTLTSNTSQQTSPILTRTRENTAHSVVRVSDGTSTPSRDPEFPAESPRRVISSANTSQQTPYHHHVLTRTDTETELRVSTGVPFHQGSSRCGTADRQEGLASEVLVRQKSYAYTSYQHHSSPGLPECDHDRNHNHCNNNPNNRNCYNSTASLPLSTVRRFERPSLPNPQRHDCRNINPPPRRHPPCPDTDPFARPTIFVIPNLQNHPNQNGGSCSAPRPLLRNGMCNRNSAPPMRSVCEQYVCCPSSGPASYNFQHQHHHQHQSPSPTPNANCGRELRFDEQIVCFNGQPFKCSKEQKQKYKYRKASRTSSGSLADC